MDQRTHNLIDECKRMEESCLYTSTTLFEWLKSLRRWRLFFVVAPIVLGGVATWPLLAQPNDYRWVTGVCALLAGIAPAIYKALDFDINLTGITQNAQAAKALQDRFRQAWRVTALGSFDDFKNEFDELMARKEIARNASLVAPERYFLKARQKMEAGHYDFAIDEQYLETPKASDQQKS
jgi:hypothetical protein